MADTFIPPARQLHIAPADVRTFNAAVKRMPPWRSQMATAIARDAIDDMAALLLIYIGDMDHPLGLGRDDSHLPKQDLDLLGRAVFSTLDANDQETVRKISRAIFGCDMRPKP